MDDEATRGGDEATLVAGHTASAQAKRSGGRVLGGRYRIQAMLGAGGMGNVFLAFDEELAERVAVKMLAPDLVADAGMLARFRSEVRLARRVTHRNVARTYDIGEDGDERFLTMEYIEGESLADRLHRLGRLPFAHILSIADGIAAGLAAAHEAGVVHRDLKPQNVMLDRNGRVVLTDFGIALGSEDVSENDVVGTPAYMAPEQIAGGAVDARADVYAFGVVLHRMATDRLPARGEAVDPCAIRPALPAGFGALVQRCLEPDPARRYANATELKAALALLPVIAEASPPTLPGSSALVQQLDVAVSRLVVVRPVKAAAEHDGIATWLTGALTEELGERPLLRTTVDDDPAAEVAIECTLDGDAERLRVGIAMRAMRDRRVFWEGEVAIAQVEVAALPRMTAHAVESALAVDIPSCPDLPPLPPSCVAMYVRARTAISSVFMDGATALPLLSSALALAPDHPLLLSAEAFAKARESFWRGQAFAAEARAACERALALAPKLAEAHVARSSLEWQLADPVAMAASIRAALALAPGHARARHMLAKVLLEAGAPGDAMRLLSDVIARTPKLDGVRVDLAHAYALRGMYARAAQALDAIPSMSVGPSSSFVWRVRQALWQHDDETARRLLDAVRDASVNTYVGAFAAFYRVAVDRRPSRTTPMIPMLSAPPDAVPRRQAVIFQARSEIDAYGGFWDDALDNLQRSVEAGLQDAFWFDRCPLFDDVRGSRRFEVLRGVMRDRGQRAIAAFDAVDSR